MENLKKEYESDVMKALANSRTPESDGIKLIIEKMWSEERLADFVDKRHHSLCEKCPRIIQAGMSKKEAAGIMGAIYALVEGVRLLAEKLALMCLAVAFLALAGCRVVEVENHGEEVVLGADGKPVMLADGRVQTISRGWSVYHGQHWMMTRADSLTASVKAGEIAFSLNGLNSDPSTNVVALVETSAKGVGTIAEKVVEAMK